MNTDDFAKKADKTVLEITTVEFWLTRLIWFGDDYAESHVSAAQRVADTSHCQDASLGPQCPNGRKHLPVLCGVLWLNLINFPPSH